MQLSFTWKHCLLLVSVVVRSVSLCCWLWDFVQGSVEVSWLIAGSFGWVFVNKWFVLGYWTVRSPYVFTERRQGGSAWLSLGFSASLNCYWCARSLTKQFTLHFIIHILESIVQWMSWFLSFIFIFRLTQTLILTAWLSMVLLGFLDFRDWGQKYLLFGTLCSNEAHLLAKSFLYQYNWGVQMHWDALMTHYKELEMFVNVDPRRVFELMGLNESPWWTSANIMLHSGFDIICL